MTSVCNSAITGMLIIEFISSRKTARKNVVDCILTLLDFIVGFYLFQVQAHKVTSWTIAKYKVEFCYYRSI